MSIATLLKMAWRPSVLVWFVQAGIGLKAAQVQRLGAVQTYDVSALDVPGHPLPVPTPGHTNGHAADTARARASLERLRPLTADVVIPGHGPAFHGTPGQAVELALQHR